jgi:hypothetical protein
MWFLRVKVLLTKDKLIKCKWKGCSKCCFCDSPETIQHLFISCPFVHIIWPMIYFIYNISPPSNITNMFGNWLNGVPKDVKARICIGVSSLCWSIWTCRNNIIFNNQKGTNLLQVLWLAAHWILLWSYVLPKDQREYIVIGWLLRTSISRLLGGGILIESKMDSILLLFIFKWLIHVVNLAEAWL